MSAVVAGLDLSRPEVARFAGVLRRFEVECRTNLGLPKPAFAVERVISRPYSEILQVLVSSPIAAPRRVFIKTVRSGPHIAEQKSMRDEVLWAYDTMTQLHREMQRFPGLSVVKPLACFPEDLTIVTEEAKGLTLLALLESRACWWPGQRTMADLELSLHRVGEWLSTYHRLASTDRGSFSVPMMRDYIDVRLKLLVDVAAGVDAAWRQRLLQAFDTTALRLQDAHLVSVPAHADMALGNLLVDGADVVVLDFAVPARGCVYHDVAHLYMQLDLLAAKPHYRPSVTRRLQRALLEGFEPGLQTDSPLFELVLFQHVACHFLGLARDGGGAHVRAFNWHVQRRHRRWLEGFSRR